MIIKSTLAIILGGGQMVQSNGVFPFYFRKLVQLATLKNKACKVIFFGIGIGVVGQVGSQQ